MVHSQQPHVSESSSLHRNTRQRKQNAARGLYRSNNCPRDLRSATGAAPVINRHFESSKMCASGAHLHLKRPAVSLFTHLESLQSIAPDLAEPPHVRTAHAV